MTNEAYNSCCVEFIFVQYVTASQLISNEIYNILLNLSNELLNLSNELLNFNNELYIKYHNEYIDHYGRKGHHIEVKNQGQRIIEVYFVHKIFPLSSTL